MEQKVLRTIQQYDMFASGGNVIVALSGGADSVALFHFLRTHAQQLGIVVLAAHLDHGLRGEESARDREFVQNLCAAANVTLHVRQAKMAETQKPTGMGTEEWARQLRYAFLEEVADAEQAVVATAHSMSDNAETVLFNLARGSGPRGLAGIPPVRGRFVRPLLGVSRGEIEDFCTANRLAYIVDSTNKDCTYARNRLRHHVLPQLEQVHQGALKNIGLAAQDMRELEIYLAQQASALLQEAKREGGYDAQMLLQAAPPVRRQALAHLAGPAAHRKHLVDIQRVLRGELGAAQLPDGVVARLCDGLVFINKPAPAAKMQAYEYPLETGEKRLPGGYTLQISLQKKDTAGGAEQKIAQKGLTFIADYDKITKCAIIRNRRDGDMFSLPGRGVTKTLKKWMNEQKLPPEMRYELPLLAAGSKVIWVWDFGFCADVQPDADSQNLLYIRTEKQEEEVPHGV